MTKEKKPKKTNKALKEIAPKKNGRPPIYNLELGKKVCRLIATSTMGLHKLCRLNPDLPSHTVIYEWRLDHPEFADQYAHAKQIQADLLAEEILEISDDSSFDIIDTPDGPKFNSEYCARSRLRVDSRKWLACKLMPKVYGDKVQNEVSGTIRHEDALKLLMPIPEPPHAI